MSKFFLTVGSVFCLALNSVCTGDCTDLTTNLDIISFKQSDKETQEMKELVPVLKDIGKDHLKERFDYASNRLKKIIKSDNKIFEIIDFEKLENELQLRKKILEGNNPEILKTNIFTRVPIPIDWDIVCNVNKMKRNVQDFLLFNRILREALWYAPTNYKSEEPTLEFVSDQTLMYRTSGILNESILCLIMMGVEMDLQVNPNLRGDDVPENTRQLLRYFTQCKNNDNNVVKKILSYQKYLDTKLNNYLTLQLLSIYIKHPEVYNCLEYIIQLTKQLCYSSDYEHIVMLINSRHMTITDIYQNFLRQQLLLPQVYDDKINSLMDSVLNTQSIDNNTKQQVTFHALCNKQLNSYLKKTVIDKFLKYRKDCKTKPSKPIFKSLINTMCKGNTGILQNMLDFFDLYSMRKVRQIMYVLPKNK